MVIYKYMNGQRYIITDANNNETKKQAFNMDIHDGINKLMGQCTAEEHLIKTSGLDDDIKKARKKITGFPKKALQTLYISNLGATLFSSLI